MDNIEITANFKDLTLFRWIGSGSYGVVHQGVWHIDGRKTDIAVKIINQDLETEKKDSKKYIVREIQNLKKCIHQNIITFYGVSKNPENRICLIFEYADCNSLYNFLHRTDTEISFNGKLDYMLQIAKGMEYLHNENIFHRDLKTENLLLFDKYRTLKICDFGTVKELATSNTEFIGTVCYMAPEVCSPNGKYNEKCDVFSFGIIFWEVMSRKKPFYELNEMYPLAIQKLIVEGHRPNINDMMIYADSEYIKPIIEKCWNPVPQNRPTMHELCVLFYFYPLSSINIKFADIELGALIGHGRSSVVHKATWQTEGQVREIALKIITNSDKDLEEKMDFLEKIRNLREFIHENIVTIYGTSLHPDNSMCLLMQFADCGTLYDYLHNINKKILFIEKIEWILQCAKGIEYLHSKGLIQGNLTTRKLFLFNDYRTLKICNSSNIKDFEAINMNFSERICYMAPEVYVDDANGKYTEKCDVFSFGIICWEVMSRKKPFDDLHPLDMEKNIINDIEAHTDHIKSIIEPCLDHNPENRPEMRELCVLLPVDASPCINVNFNEIELGAYLGRGSYGVVHKATWQTEGQVKEIAVKVISHNSEYFQKDMSFLTEIRDLKKLNHENVVVFHGISMHPDSYICLVFEYSVCGSLYKYLHNMEKQISFIEKLHWMLQCAQGLKYLHSKKTVHQDLNIKSLLLFNKYRTLKIYDFGTVKKFAMKNTESIGTVCYKAPEAWEANGKYTEKCDVFSFAIIFWEVMSSKNPLDAFGNMQLFDIQKKIINGYRPDINDMRPFDNSDRITQIIQKCWERDPETRPTINEIVNLLGNDTRLYININYKDIELKLGNGCYGRGWRAIWRTAFPDGEVAVKIIPCDKQNEFAVLKETHKLKNLSHENIATFYGVSRDPYGTLCAIVEYAKCGSLYNLLHDTNNMIYFFEKLNWMWQCVKGLDYLHRKNSVHRHLKTQNLLLFNEYRTLKICDYGRVNGIDASFTVPEDNSEVLSFGIILWEVMTRKKPFIDFKDFQPISLQKQIIDGARPNINDLTHKDAIRMKPIIERCWNKYPKDRPTILELLGDFNKCVEDYTDSTCGDKQCKLQ